MMTASKPYTPAQKVWEPWRRLSKPELVALKAVQRGEATEEQQRLFWIYLTEKLCATYDTSYHPDSARDTDFAEGKRFVGNELIKLSKAPMTIIEDTNERNRKPGKSSGEQPA